MKKHFLLIISIAALFFSCEKNSAAIESFKGNEIDSVTQFTVNASDTIAQSSVKFNFNADKNIISSKFYIYNTTTNQFVLSSTNTIDIQDKKESIISTFLNGRVETYDFSFDYNNFLRTSIFSNNIDEQYQNSTYVYGSNRQLYQAIHIRHNLYNNAIKKYKYTYTYLWENDNIKQISFENIDLSTSIVTKSSTKYKYSSALNPLNHHYENNYRFAFEKLGKSCKNLVSSIDYGDSIWNINYEQDTSKNKLIIKKTSALSGSTSLTEIFYTD